MAKTVSALICLLALLPAATAAAAEPPPTAQDLVANATSTAQTTASQTTAAVEAAPRTVSATVESTTSNVQTTAETATKTLGGAVAAVDNAAPVAQPATPVVRAVAASPTSGATRSTATRESPGANAVGRAADAISGIKPVALAGVDRGAAALRDVTSPLPLADLATPQAQPAAAASSAPARSGGDGSDTHDGPGGVTGGISGPFGFVLIAAVLAGIFLMAPRLIGRPLHMTSWRPRSAALALPIEWPD